MKTAMMRLGRGRVLCDKERALQYRSTTPRVRPTIKVKGCVRDKAISEEAASASGCKQKMKQAPKACS
jgi:hypothetical protein